MFNPRRSRRGGGGFMSGGWSQPIFNMNPLDVISNFVSPVLDIISPLEDINELMGQGRRMYRQTPSVLPQIVQQRRRKTTPIVKPRVAGIRLPQKYRIVIDCTGIVNPNALRTNIKCVQDNKHLIVSSDLKKGRQFKRSYTLPREVETKKMTKYVTPQCQLVIEFNYVDVPLSLAICPQPTICTTPEHGKCVHVSVPIAEFVEPAKVKLHVKGRDLFAHFEERIVPCGDSCSRVIYHTRVQLPRNTNVNAITAKCDKHKLTILAPIGVKKEEAGVKISQELRDIAVKRKLRHRKARAVSVGAEQKQVTPPTVTGEKKKKEKKKPAQPSAISEKEKKAPLETTPTKPKISEQLPTAISKKQQKKQKLLEKKPEEQKPSILKKPEEEKKTPAEQLAGAGVKAEEKKKKKKEKKKVTATTTTPTPTATTPTPEEQKKEPSPIEAESGKREEREPVRTTGADVLKNIFESSGQSSSQQQQGRESATSTAQPSASSERVPTA